MNVWKNACAIPLSELSDASFEDFQNRLSHLLSKGAQLLSLFGVPNSSSFLENIASPNTVQEIRLFAICGDPQNGVIEPLTTVVQDTFLSLTEQHPQVQLFERELAEKWRLIPQGHPWLKPVRFEHPLREGMNVWEAHPAACGVAEFFQMEGEEIHEVAVGPVHAGIIEPGHFRFQCHGETVYHLRFCWDISIAVLNEHLWVGLVSGRYTLWKHLQGIQLLVMQVCIVRWPKLPLVFWYLLELVYCAALPLNWNA